MKSNKDDEFKTSRADWIYRKNITVPSNQVADKPKPRTRNKLSADQKPSNTFVRQGYTTRTHFFDVTGTSIVQARPKSKCTTSDAAIQLAPFKNQIIIRAEQRYLKDDEGDQSPHQKQFYESLLEDDDGISPFESMKLVANHVDPLHPSQQLKSQSDFLSKTDIALKPNEEAIINASKQLRTSEVRLNKDLTLIQTRRTSVIEKHPSQIATSSINIFDLPEQARKSLIIPKKRTPSGYQYDQNMNATLMSVSEALNPYLKTKPTAATVTSFKYQQDCRMMRNTYQLSHLSKLQMPAPKQSSNVGEGRQRRGMSVDPKSFIRIPKDIILYQLSQKPDLNIKDMRETTLIGESRNIHDEIKQFRTHHSNSSYRFNNSDSQDTAGVQFNITQLLEKALKSSRQDIEAISHNPESKYFYSNDLETQKVLECYKRTVRNDTQKPIKIMISNYRLQIVSKDYEFTNMDRVQFGRNSGTTIYVSNSIIQPENFNFTTQVDIKQIQVDIDQLRAQKPVRVKKNQDLDDADLDAILAKTLSIGRETQSSTNIKICDTPSFPHFEGMLDESLVLDEKLDQKITLRHSKLIATWFEGLKIQCSQLNNASTLTLHKDSPPTNQSQFFDHLKSTKVNKGTILQLKQLMQESVKIEFKEERLERALVNINYQQTQRAIQLMRRDYTHLDISCLNNERLPIELFINYDKWIGPIAANIYDNQVIAQIQQLNSGESHYFTGQIIEFDSKSLRFLVENKQLGVKTWHS